MRAVLFGIGAGLGAAAAAAAVLVGFVLLVEAVDHECCDDVIYGGGKNYYEAKEWPRGERAA